jgi:hypothetical protein
MTTKPQDSSGVDDPDETPWCQGCRKDLDKCTCNPIRHSSGASEAGRVKLPRWPTNDEIADQVERDLNLAPSLCVTQRHWTLTEVQREDARMNPNAKGPSSFVCQKCGYWHVKSEAGTKEEK